MRTDFTTSRRNVNLRLLETRRLFVNVYPYFSNNIVVLSGEFYHFFSISEKIILISREFIILYQLIYLFLFYLLARGISSFDFDNFFHASQNAW